MKRALPVAVSLLAATIVHAAWENPAPVQGGASTRAAPYRAPSGRSAAPSEPLLRGTATESLYGEGGVADSWGPRYGDIAPELYCQTLDSPMHPLSYTTLAFVPETQFGAYGSASLVEFDAAWRLFALEEFFMGDLEGFFDSRLLGFTGGTEMTALPDVAAALAFETAASWRYVNGWSLELRVAPGMYSDIAAPQFACPFTVNMHYAVAPDLAGVGGLTIRPGWDLPIMPNVGLAWQPNPVFRLEAMLPRSRVMVSPVEAFTLFGTLEWRNVDYALDEEPGTPPSFTLNDWLATAGVMVSLDEWNRLSFEFGTFLLRELSADVEKDSTVELSKEWIARVGWHGAF